ncbi:group 3 secretory phospholipase A2-like [Cololabis saira]|uniref:group 3 secretory phospholipase A2-like n=1 Tax=Cololabis saira TaxID=129043 RepID=UPI002AD234B9|nr:group 3 secretory phospholipase A2-like [Cololabis saira]
MFEGADKCCREHDHCLHIIPAFKMKYGVFNRNFFTVSHCECDQRFRLCLLGMNDSISSMVGYSFFNILQVPCFELKQLKRCTEMYWWGMCKVAREAPYAVFKSPLPYNSSDVTNKYEHAHNNNLTSSEGQLLTQNPVTSPQRKSPKAEHRCGLRQPSRGDTFHRRREKGKGCNRHRKPGGVAPSQVPVTSKAHTTTLYVNMGLSKNKTLIRKGLPGFAKRSRIHQPSTNHFATNSNPATSSTTLSSIASLTQSLKRRPGSTAPVVRVTKTSKGHKKITKKSRCCEPSMPVRRDTVQGHCKSCLKQEGAFKMTTVTPAKTTTSGLQREQMKQESAHLKKTTETPAWDASATRWNATTFATPITTKLKSTASFHRNSKPQKRIHLYPPWNIKSQETLGGTIAQNIHAVESLKENNVFHNMTDDQFQCQSLKHLDDCKFKIPPQEKKYNLENKESKTVYHCDCISRLAARINSFKQSSIVPSLLKDFVSQQCFKLPKEKKFHCNKRCSRGFAKASDLHRVLKKTKRKDISGMRVSASERKRGIPVRLYKRCLKLTKGADKMALLND